MGRGLSQQTKDIIAFANRLWTEEFEPRGIVPTVRQLFYQLAVAQLVPKSEKGYAQAQRILARARERGDYPWEGIFDTLRQLHRPAAWQNLDEFLDVVRGSYARDRWPHQPRRVEVWVEKDAVVGTVRSVTTDHQVPLLCGRGYLSLTAKNEACRRIAKRPATILYVGDHDPSGINMLEETEAWLRAELPPDADFLVERIAITDEDHADPQLPHLPVNPKDSRARAYMRRYGSEVVEVEPLPAVELQRRVEAAILRRRDDHAWAEAKRLERRDRAVLEVLLDGDAA